MVFLLNIQLPRDREQRSNAFVAIGLVAIAVEDHTKPYLAKILDAIRSALPSKV